jgi:hypothetical protein
MPDDELLLKEGGCHKQDDGMECKVVLVVRVGREKTGEAWTGSGGRAQVVLSPKQEALGGRYQGSFHLHVSK